MTMTAETDLGGAPASPHAAAAEAMNGVATAVDVLLAADFTLPGTTDILDLLRGIETQARRLHTASVRVTAQIVDRGLAAPAGASSTAALLRQMLPLSAADAHQRVRLAAATCPTTGLTGAPIPPVLPVLAAALGAGSIGAAQAATIVTTLNGLPADVPVELRESVEEFLVEQAAVLDPKTLHNVARRIALMANPDGPYDERDAGEKQEFHIGARREDGLTRCWGLLDDLTVEALRAALGALCAPAADRNQPAVTSTPDPGAPTGETEPSTAMPTTVPPTTVRQTTLRQTTVRQTTVRQTTLRQTTLRPTTLRPTTLRPTTLRPTTVRQTTVRPTTVRPTTLRPTTLQPRPVRPSQTRTSTTPPHPASRGDRPARRTNGRRSAPCPATIRRRTPTTQTPTGNPRRTDRHRTSHHRRKTADPRRPAAPTPCPPSSPHSSTAAPRPPSTAKNHTCSSPSAKPTCAKG